MPFTQLNNFVHLPKNQEAMANILQPKKSVRNIMYNHEDNKNETVSKTSKKSFQYKYIIGKGGFGKVWKVQHNKTRNQYAMK